MRQSVCTFIAMPQTDEGAKAWQLEWSERIGRAVQTRRKELGLTGEQLAKRTRALGYPISRVAIGKIESNGRTGKMDVAEVAVLAAALNIPPVMLLYPGLPHARYRDLPYSEHTALDALLWHTGEALGYNGFDSSDPAATQTAAQPLNLARTLHQSEQERRTAVAAIEASRTTQEVQFLERSAQQQLRIRDQIVSMMQTLGLPVNPEYVTKDPGQSGDGNS